MGYMRDKIGDAAMYEQLAEEASELCKAALKMARILRGENPTPVTDDEARINLIEELTDVMLCVDELDLRADSRVALRKSRRFRQRWEESHAGKS